MLLTSEHAFLVCESTIVELFKHKEKIVSSSKLSETDIVRLFYLLLQQLTVYREVLIAPEARYTKPTGSVLTSTRLTRRT